MSRDASRSGAPPGRRPTIADVAARAGVSIGAVSLAMNGRPGVSASTAARVRAAATELGWMPNVRARGLSQSRAQAVGIVIHRPAELIGTDPFFSDLIAGVEAVLADREHALLIRVVRDVEQEASTYKTLAAEGRVDGFLLTDLRDRDTRLGLLQELGLPAVVVGRPGPTCPFPAVGPDDRAATREAVGHLVTLGHTRIAHVAGIPGYIHSRARELAWREGLKAAGLGAGPVVSGGFSASGGAEATRQVLATERCTAILYANDLMAIAGMSAAAELGLRVPEDLSVIGFDDISLAAHVSPALTTISRDTQEWARRCAEALMTLIDGGSAPKRASFPSRLVVRASTAPPPAPQPRRGRRSTARA